MGWSAIVMPLSDFTDDPGWLSEVVVDPLPAVLPAARPSPSAAQVLTLLRGAGLSGETQPRVSDALDDLARDPTAVGPTTLTHVLLHTAHADATLDRIVPDTPVTTISLDKPHPHAVLVAAAALVPVWGAVVVMEASGCRSLVVDGPVVDLEATTVHWLGG